MSSPNGMPPPLPTSYATSASAAASIPSYRSVSHGVERPQPTRLLPGWAQHRTWTSKPVQSSPASACSTGSSSASATAASVAAASAVAASAAVASVAAVATAISSAGGVIACSPAHERGLPCRCELCLRRSAFGCSTNGNGGDVAAPDRAFACSVCARRFSTRGLVKRHMRVHSGARPFKCDVCGSSFSRSDSLKVHLRGHTGERPHACDSCDKAFRDRSTLTKHKRIVHGGGADAFPCSVCGKRFSTRPLVRRHMLIHTGVRNFSCSICGKKFARADSLKIHERRHDISPSGGIAASVPSSPSMTMAMHISMPMPISMTMPMRAQVKHATAPPAVYQRAKQEQLH